ncbi:hypothetical protein K1719_019292 [Acacia pycnantha]|nr:hypothetical protein K1719_019292 [Acacia pycnantha]
MTELIKAKPAALFILKYGELSGSKSKAATFFAPSEERLESGLYSRSYLENQMAVALGGRVAEEVIFGEDNVTTGASNDFMQVSRVAKQMVERFVAGVIAEVDAELHQVLI